MKLNKDYIVPKSHLFKNAPDTATILDFYQSSQDYLTNTIELINGTSDLYLSYLDNIAAFNIQAVQDIKVLYNLLGDLFLLAGNTQNSYQLNDLNQFVYSNTNVEVNLSTDEVRIAIDPNYVDNFVSTNVQIKSVQIIPFPGRAFGRDIFMGTYGALNKNNNPINTISDIYELDLYSVNRSLSFQILIDLGSVKPINDLFFVSDKKIIPYLTITQLEVGQTSALSPIKIINSNALTANGYDIISTISGSTALFNIRFDNQLTRYIKISVDYSGFDVIAQNRIYDMYIKSLSTGFYVPTNSGEIVFGPLKLNDDLVKTSLDCILDNYIQSSNNVILSVATNPAGPFNSLLNSIEYNPTSTLSNVLNFNNVATNSINTTDPVKAFYLKISLTATQQDLSQIISIQNSNVEAYIQRTKATLTSKNSNVTIPSSASDVEVFRELKSYSGYDSVFQKNFLFNIYNVVETQQSNNYGGLNLYGGSNSLDLNIGTYTPVTDINIITRPEKCQIVVAEKTTCKTIDNFDKYKINVFGFSNPITSPISGSTTLINNRNLFTPSRTDVMFVLPVNTKGSYYKFVLDNGGQLTVDITARFFYSVLETYIIINNPSVRKYTVYDEIGILIGTFNLRTTGSVNYVSLFDVFDITVPTVSGFIFNTEFGITDVSSVPGSPNQFTLTTDGLIFSKFYTGSVINQARIIKTDIEKTYQDGQLILASPKITKFTEVLTSGDYAKVFKLSNTNIVDGTITFNIGGASINPFVQEVDFIDGHSEFVLTTTFEQINNYNLNIITLSTEFSGDEFSNVVFDGDDSLFVNRVYTKEELINLGDWCLLFDTDSNRWGIYLPVDATTSSIIDTKVIYNITADVNSYGLYSINYNRGIIYTTAPMDSRIEVDYIFSNTYAKYEHYYELPSDSFMVNSGTVNIKDTDDVQTGDYVIVYNTLNSLTASKQVNVSPVVKNIVLNILTKSEIL